MISELAQRVFQARDIAHIHHWKSRSYAEHMALGAFYDDAIEAIDAVMENYVGMFGAVDVETAKADPVANIREYLTEEMDWIESNIDELSNGSPSIGNLIQALISVYSRAVYMLGLK